MVPLGAVGVDTVSVMATKLAVTVFEPFIDIEVGFVDPERFPDQLPNPYPALAAAETETLAPLLCHVVPEGTTTPPTEGLADVIRLY